MDSEDYGYEEDFDWMVEEQELEDFEQCDEWYGYYGEGTRL